MKIFRPVKIDTDASSPSSESPESSQSPTRPPSDGLFARLAATRRNLSDGLAGLLSGGRASRNDGGVVDGARLEELLEELHDQLLLADVGVEASERIINRLRRDSKAGILAAQLADSLRMVVAEILAPCAMPLRIDTAAKPFVILMVGVNGTGKTTTLAKLAARLRGEGNQVMLAAGDTFRAAAIEQLQTWGQRLDVPVIAQTHGADAAAVAFDAHSAARARGMDVLLIDTAGRQHTRGDLMEQLKKIKRVLRKVDSAAPHEILLNIDAGNGYNALSQVEHFQQAVGIDGLCVTKLDGTAKGGVVVALAERFELPIRYVGSGQEISDIQPFSAEEFITALLPETR